MNDIGHLYVLANSAMPGLVKIGKTTRSPAERAVELSSATGLPTQFIVVYEQLFGDCSAAESFVHTYLATKGFRVSDRREFFSAPVNDVVRAIVLAPGALNGDTGGAIDPETELMDQHQADELDDLNLDSSALWESIFEEAEDHYYGFGDTLQDFKEAMKLYVHAAKLGALPAYSQIGEMYLQGKGVQANADTALKYFKEGARKGSVFCYWAMGMLFWRSEDYPEKNTLENTNKCFSIFLRCLDEGLSGGQLLTEDQWISVDQDCVSLLIPKVLHDIEPPVVLNIFFFQRIESIRARVQGMIEFCRKKNDSKWQRNYEALFDYLSTINT